MTASSRLMQPGSEAYRSFLEAVAPLRPNEVFQTYWHFAAERQRVLLRRLAGEPPPWTDDPILQTYRFTNAYRVSDRVSQYLLTNVLYNGEWSPEDLFFRCILYKLFNKIETWELIREEFGEPTVRSFVLPTWDFFLSAQMAKGTRLYSAAYIMPSGGKSAGIPSRKHSFHLRLLDRMLMDGLPGKIAAAPTLENVFQQLVSYPGIGSFLAFQYTIDLNYSPLINFDEGDCVVAGPGAKSGIAKCFDDTRGFTPEEVIHHVTDRQENLTAALGIDFLKLSGRRLQPIDCQNLFCETDKYARVYHPSRVGLGDRQRIKRRYTCYQTPCPLWLPPKWSPSYP